MKAVFELFQKLHLVIYASQFMASYIIPISFVPLNLESVERRGKLQKFEYLKNEKSFMKWKAFFIFFEGLLLGKKIKNDRHKY